MPQVIAGTGLALTKTISQLVKELLENNWPTAAFDPLKADIGFGLDTWDNYGDIDIHVNADTVLSEILSLGGVLSRNIEGVTIHLYVRKNVEEIPSNMGAAQRKIEEIIKDNIVNLGQGIDMVVWNGWDPIFVDPNLQDVWHAIGRCSAIYQLRKTS